MTVNRLLVYIMVLFMSLCCREMHAWQTAGLARRVWTSAGRRLASSTLSYRAHVWDSRRYLARKKSPFDIATAAETPKPLLQQQKKELPTLAPGKS